MKSYYDKNGIVIYNADCRHVLPGLRGDALVTDPPYGTNIREGAPWEYADRVNWMLEISRVAVPRGICIAILKSNETISITDARLHNAQVAFVDGKKVEAREIALAWRTGCCRRRVMMQNVYSDPQGGLDRSVHPSPRSLNLILELVTLAAKPGALVLDPFMGSGSTLVAALRCKRKAIGIEIEEKYCELAAKRVENEMRSIDS